MNKIIWQQSNKYNAKKAVCLFGHLHDSTKEAARCQELHLLLKAGKIKDLRLQVDYELLPSKKYQPPTKNEKRIIYKADFVYYDCELDKVIIEDCKGKKTKDYIIKRKYMKDKYCDEHTAFIET